MDRTQTRRPGREVQRVNVDFPLELLRAIDAEAKRIGVTRQAFIKQLLRAIDAEAKRIGVTRQAFIKLRLADTEQ